MTKAARRPKFRERELKLSDAVNEAYSELESLATEMREAFDNMPEGLQGSDKGQAREAAADDLEGISEPDVPKSLDVETNVVKWTVPARSPSQERRLSRATRRDDAVQTLTAVNDYLEKLQEDSARSDEEKQEAADFVDELLSAIETAEGVEFPGMY